MRSIDPARLINAVQKDGKTVARCPACAARGGDTTGNNLVVFTDGRFGCQAAKGDKEHNRQILELAGTQETGSTEGRIPIRRILHPPSTVIKTVGRLGRGLSTAQPVEVAVSDAVKVSGADALTDVSAPSETGPPRPTEPSVDSVAADPAVNAQQPTGRPKVPEAVQEGLKRLKWLPDGRVVDTSQLDEDGCPVFVDWPRCTRLTDNADVVTVMAEPETEGVLEDEDEKLLASLGFGRLPDGTIIDPTRMLGERAVGWCPPPSA